MKGLTKAQRATLEIMLAQPMYRSIFRTDTLTNLERRGFAKPQKEIEGDYVVWYECITDAGRKALEDKEDGER